MDLDTFITTLYVWIDDWYKAKIEKLIKRQRGPAPRMSDSEVLTVAIAGQWRAGVPWQSERSLVRYMQTHGRQWFPTMLGRSRYNERVRYLGSVIIQLQQDLAQIGQVESSPYEVVDCLPLPSCSKSQAGKKGHWLWWSTWGYGGTQSRQYWGTQMIMSVASSGRITGWLVSTANVDDRVMLQALLSQRHGHYEFITPQPWRPWRQLMPPGMMYPLFAAGSCHQTADCYIADKGFNGYQWHNHWYARYGVHVVTEPTQGTQPFPLPQSWTKWLRGMRQIVETTFAILAEVFDIKRLRAHSQLGQYTRIALATAAYNWGLWINSQLARPQLSHATLIL